MNEHEDLKDKLIDIYYKEDILQNKEKENVNFSIKLESSLNKMDELHKLDFDLEINILDIISQGEKIKENRKFKLDIVKFFAISICIILFITISTVIFKTRFFFYFYIALSTLIPFTLIPIAKFSRAKEVF